MIELDAAGLAAGAVGAILLTWLIESAALHLLGAKPWWVAPMRGFGLALVSLIMLVFLRLFTPDLFVPPLLFLAVFAVDILIGGRSSRGRERLAISTLVSMFATGALLMVDGALRLSGYRLFLGL
jgi:hypothetical protein